MIQIETQTKNPYEQRITEQLRPHLNNPVTRLYIQRLIRSAVRYEFAHRSYCFHVAAMELRRYNRIVEALGFDPLD